MTDEPHKNKRPRSANIKSRAGHATSSGVVHSDVREFALENELISEINEEKLFRTCVDSEEYVHQMQLMFHNTENNSEVDHLRTLFNKTSAEDTVDTKITVDSVLGEAQSQEGVELCPKCGANMRPAEIQNRTADEPMQVTYYCTRGNCKGFKADESR